jgi:flagellar biosynthesis GTPase FlhF
MPQGVNGGMPDDAQQQQSSDASKDQKADAGGDGATGQDDYAELRNALDAERKQKKEAEKERDALKRAQAERDAAEAKAKEEDAAAKGEFESIAQKREQERDQARQEAMALKAENDQFREAIRLVIAAEWDKLPEEVREAFLGDDEDVLGKLHFLPKGKALAAKLSEKAEAVRGNGFDPKSSGGKKSNDEAARKAQAAMYRQL